MLRAIAYGLFVFAGVVGVAAFALWGNAILQGDSTLGWLGALAAVFAIVVSFVGAGLIHTAEQAEERSRS